MNEAAMAVIVQTAALVLSAVGVVATIVWNRIVARRRATIDMLMAEPTTRALLEIRSDYLEAWKSGSLESCATEEKWYTPESFFLVSTLK
jgi:hypothetical protein